MPQSEEKEAEVTHTYSWPVANRILCHMWSNQIGDVMTQQPNTMTKYHEYD